MTIIGPSSSTLEHSFIKHGPHRRPTTSLKSASAQRPAQTTSTPLLQSSDIRTRNNFQASSLSGRHSQLWWQGQCKLIKTSQIFKVQHIALGVQVQNSGRLGFALTPCAGNTSLSNLPIRYLMPDTSGKKSDHVLYGLARTHVLPSGLDLKPLVHRLESRELKCYAAVV
jgi:hypothetical protein